jgi:uroporphyrinogen-III synthase
VARLRTFSRLMALVVTSPRAVRAAATLPTMSFEAARAPAVARLAAVAFSLAFFEMRVGPVRRLRMEI